MLPIRIRSSKALVAASFLVLVGSVTIAQAKSFDYRDFAAGEVPQMRYTRLDNWQPIGGPRLIVWDGAKRAWLIGVAPPCAGLEKAKLLGITAMGGRIHVGADEVIAAGRRCRIQHLQRLDVEQLTAFGQLPTEQRRVQIRPRQPAPSHQLRRGN